MRGPVRKIQILVGTFALVLALLASAGGSFGIQKASALTIGTANGGWTPANFASSCEAAGGMLIEVDVPGKKYSKCEFKDGVNKCDWIAKVCTFGIVAGPFTMRGDAVHGTLTTSGSGSTTTQTSGTLTPKER